MARFFDKRTHDIVWHENDLYGVLDEQFLELTDFLAMKKLDGHNEEHQWYMLVHRKMSELLDVLGKNPRELNLETDKEIL